MNLNLHGAPNARDLGGLRTADGRTIRPGLLLRSGELSRLTAADAETLQHLNLKTVVDFRTERERTQKPDVRLPGVQYVICPIIRELAVGITREEEANAVPPMVRAAIACGKRAEDYMASLYPPLVEDDYSIGQYRSFLELVLHHSDGALLYHCTAGKDRVGVGTLLLLSALGVDRKTILEDYLLTNIQIAPDTERMLAEARRYTSAPDALDALRTFDSAKEAYINLIWDSVESRYGSIDAFLAERLGIGPDARETLRQKYLTETGAAV